MMYVHVQERNNKEKLDRKRRQFGEISGIGSLGLVGAAYLVRGVIG